MPEIFSYNIDVKRFRVVFAALCLSAALSGAFAEGEMYWSFKPGAGFTAWKQEIDAPLGGSLATALGWRAKAGYATLRSDFEVAGYFFMTRKSEEEAFKYEKEYNYLQLAGSYMVNFYIDFFEKSRTRPYMGLGYGIMRIHHQGDFREKTRPAFGRPVEESYEVGGTYSAFVKMPKIGIISDTPTDGLKTDFSLEFARPNVNGDNLFMFNARLGIHRVF